MPPTHSSATPARPTANAAGQITHSETTCPGASPSFSTFAKDILRHLDRSISNPPLEYPGLEEHETLGPEMLSDIRTRFLLWTGNLGVMHKPEDPRALDKRLLDAPEVASRVREILKDLHDLLNQSKKSCDCNTTQDSPTRGDQNIDDEDAMMMQLLGLQTSKSCINSWLSASLNDTLRRLFHLSSLITKSSTRDRFVRAKEKCRLAMYERHDIQHVREKVKYAGGRADEALVTRLGKANTSRRQFITYSREHIAELSRVDQHHDTSLVPNCTEPERYGTGGKSSVGPSVSRSETTKQSAVPTKASTVGMVDSKEFDYGLDDARSCSTIATSIVDGQALGGLKIPELVHYAKPGEHFICPLCQTVQRFNGQIAWRRHVFSDIRAYICTSKECGMLMFDSFNTWRSHELDHRREWICSLCSLSCQDKAKIKTHLIDSHGDKVENLQLDTLLQMCSRPPEQLHAANCPFCDWSSILQERNPTSRRRDLSVPSRRFMKHLGKHLEEFALFVVPQPDEDDATTKDIGSNEAHINDIDDDNSISTLSTFRSALSVRIDTYARFDRVQEVEGGVIHCICGFIEDDGNSVACDSCNTWAHVVCYYPQYKDNLPADLQHLCLECQPGQFDTAHVLDAQVRQHMLREEKRALSKSTIAKAKSKIDKHAMLPIGANNNHSLPTELPSKSDSSPDRRRLAQNESLGDITSSYPVLTDTGRISKARKGARVHVCDCGKTFTRAEHLRRHQQNHEPGAYICDFAGCEIAFVREDLLQRHRARHSVPKLTSGQSPNALSSFALDQDSPPTHTTFDRAKVPRNLLSWYDSMTEYSVMESLSGQRQAQSLLREDQLSNTADKGICPVTTCGRYIDEGLEAHKLTHKNERPEKCPIATCEYHTKGFARKHERNRHSLTHYKGTMVCGFCPGFGTSADKSFNRADVFKRHLTSVHGVEQRAPNTRRRALSTRLPVDMVQTSASNCSTCGIMFSDAQQFYNHLDDCLLRVVEQAKPSEVINERHLMSVADNLAVLASIERHNLPTAENSQQERLRIPQREHESRSLNFDDSTGYLDRPHATPVADSQSDWYSEPTERPSQDGRLLATQHSLLDGRLKAGNMARSSSPYLYSHKHSPFRSGSPLAPRQEVWNQQRTPSRISNSQSRFQQGRDFNLPSIMARQADASRWHEPRHEAVLASTSYVPDNVLNDQAISWNKPDIHVTPADWVRHVGQMRSDTDSSTNAQAMLTRQQQQDAIAHAEVLKHQDSPKNKIPETIAPRDMFIDFSGDAPPEERVSPEAQLRWSEEQNKTLLPTASRETNVMSMHSGMPVLSGSLGNSQCNISPDCQTDLKLLKEQHQSWVQNAQDASSLTAAQHPSSLMSGGWSYDNEFLTYRGNEHDFVDPNNTPGQAHTRHA